MGTLASKALMSDLIRIAGEMPATTALRYSRWERFHYRVLGYWPRSVVDRRLAALVTDERRVRELVSVWLASNGGS